MNIIVGSFKKNVITAIILFYIISIMIFLLHDELPFRISSIFIYAIVFLGCVGAFTLFYFGVKQYRLEKKSGKTIAWYNQIKLLLALFSLLPGLGVATWIFTTFPFSPLLFSIETVVDSVWVIAFILILILIARVLLMQKYRH